MPRKNPFKNSSISSSGSSYPSKNTTNNSSTYSPTSYSVSDDDSTEFNIVLWASFLPFVALFINSFLGAFVDKSDSTASSLTIAILATIGTVLSAVFGWVATSVWAFFIICDASYILAGILGFIFLDDDYLILQIVIGIILFVLSIAASICVFMFL